MTKELLKVCLKRSKLRNKFLKSRTLSDRRTYTSQRNLCKKVLEKTKRTYFNNLDIEKITDNRTFWRNVVPVFSNKFTTSEKINMTERNKTISNDDEICWVLNIFFQKLSLKFWVFQIMRFITLRKRSTERCTQIFWRSEEKSFWCKFYL